MKMTIRKIEEKDNREIEKIIRDCLIEFGANHEGTAWADTCLSNLYNIYNKEKNIYYVAEVNLEIVAGCGIFYLNDECCELQKMYCKKEFRGMGIAQKLIDSCLDFAKLYYKMCYLETLENMKRAISLYERNGFERIDNPIVDTGHFSCDIRYIKKL